MMTSGPVQGEGADGGQIWVPRENRIRHKALLAAPGFAFSGLAAPVLNPMNQAVLGPVPMASISSV